MRTLPLLAALALLGACAGPLPQPDPQQAWIEFRTEPGDLLMAELVDGRRMDDGRYFQVSPGAHQLEVSYRFEAYIGSMFARDPVHMLCYLRVNYADFAAGQRYLLHARHLQLHTESWLSDASGKRLAEGQKWHCIY